MSKARKITSESHESGVGLILTKLLSLAVSSDLTVKVNEMTSTVKP